MKLKQICIVAAAVALLIACGGTKNESAKEEMGFSLKEAFGDKFLVGVALTQWQVAGADSAATELVKQHFNSVVAENCMKCEVIHPEEDRYDFTEADRLVEFGEENGMAVIGHCLIWHSQCAPWFFVDKEGNRVSPEVLKQRMKEHITTIMARYKGRIHGWDVVNEAIVEDGSFRQSPFYEILGEEFIPYAFQCAYEADPDVELYYNDYGMNVPGRRDAVAALVRKLKERGLRIDAVGMQGHMGMDYPTLEDFEKSMLAFAAEGVKVMITEWDMSALPTVGFSANISDTAAFEAAKNPYPDELPDSVSHEWNARMKSIFDLCLKHADIVSRVTTWGVTDGDSWKNGFPIRGRKDYPLLFDRQYQPKPFVRELLQPKKATFDKFTYSAVGIDMQSDSARSLLVNPIIPGCYPDPSICRVDDDYYLVNSSFAYFPGVPIWHSNDLLHWERLGYVLNRPSQLDIKDGQRISAGIYAPDIKYNPHNKLFYMITTNVSGVGNFFVTTSDPKTGNWSDPVILPEVGGIDPSFLFDDDGKAYIVNNDAPEGEPLYDGHRAIWIREFDWKNGCTVGEQQVIINGGVDILQKPIWIEGPHLYHINGRYYLMAAEGGTGPDHSEVVFSASSPFGPFTPCKTNPILTQRDLRPDRPYAVTCAGHADLVQTPEGAWYAVFLGVRPYKGGHDIMGRETFMLPVTWDDEQPVILPPLTRIYYSDRYVEETRLWDKNGLSPEAFYIRTPQTEFFTIDPVANLEMTARSVTLDESRQPAAIGRWITHGKYKAETSFRFRPTAEGDFAGLILFHSDGSYIRFGKSMNQEKKPCLELTVYSNHQLVKKSTVGISDADADRKLYIYASGDGEGYHTFHYSFQPELEWKLYGEPVISDPISTETAGGFTGTMVGIYATGDYR